MHNAVVTVSQVEITEDDDNWISYQRIQRDPKKSVRKMANGVGNGFVYRRHCGSIVVD